MVGQEGNSAILFLEWKVIMTNQRDLAFKPKRIIVAYQLGLYFWWS